MPHHKLYWTPVPTAQQSLSARQGLQIHGPRIRVEIGVPDAFAEELTREGRELPSPVIGFGLIDTGASNTSIDSDVATSLGLQVSNTITVMTPAGPHSSSVYGAKLSFPGTVLPALPTIFAAGTVLNNQGLVALIGRDFLHGKILHYDGASCLITLSW